MEISRAGPTTTILFSCILDICGPYAVSSTAVLNLNTIKKTSQEQIYCFWDPVYWNCSSTIIFSNKIFASCEMWVLRMVRCSHLHLKILKIIVQILKIVMLDVRFIVLVGIRTSMSILLLETLNSPWITSRSSIPMPVLTPGNMESLGPITKEATVSVLGFT